MAAPRISASAILITQGTHRFYALTLPSDLLAVSCFASARDEDPKAGFQRLLDHKRAKEIAEYVDDGLGTIPTSIILSAQPDADFEYVRKTKTVSFKAIKKAFLILDGQHRVYGFSLAKAGLRVPVVVYTGLSRRDETRVFIDINTKQRPVSNELLLDIKRLAEYESDAEQQLRALFDLFCDDPRSPLLGLMSRTTRKKGNLSRVTFNAGLKKLLPTLSSVDPEEAYETLASYIAAHQALLDRISAKDSLTKPIYFKAAMRLFPVVAQRVQDRFGSDYNVDNFAEVLVPAFSKIQSAKLRNPGKSVPALYELFVKALQTAFSL